MAEEVTKPKVRKEDGASQFDHPVYKKIALINGEVNRMTKEQLKDRLAELRLDTRGVKEVLKKRLKNHYKRQKLMKANVHTRPKDPHYDYYLVIDFEATCEEFNVNYKHEIIEFPIILVDAKTRQVVEEFHSYVNPLINHTLTSFCRELTGISQKQVDTAETFPSVLDHVTEWMAERGLGKEKTFAVVTDGPWDMGRFMYQQCQHSNLAFPNWARKWVNLRKAYRNFYRCKKAKLKLSEILESLGMTFEGHMHSGIDDSRNISRVLLHMLADGASMKVNEELYSYKIKNRPDAGTGEMKVGAIHGESSSEDGGDFDGDESLQAKLRALELSEEDGEENNALQTSSPPVSDNEDYDDLLTYYALQKSQPIV